MGHFVSSRMMSPISATPKPGLTQVPVLIPIRNAAISSSQPPTQTFQPYASRILADESIDSVKSNERYPDNEHSYLPQPDFSNIYLPVADPMSGADSVPAEDTPELYMSSTTNYTGANGSFADGLDHTKKKQSSQFASNDHKSSLEECAAIKSVHPMFLSRKTDLSYVEDLKIPKGLLSYTFFSDVTMKLHFYAMNTMPFRICLDPSNRILIVEITKFAPLYDFMYHSLLAVSLLDLYYQKVLTGTDDVLDLDKSVYLMLGDYHMSRSMRELVEEVKVEEDVKKCVTLILTTMMHIFYATGCPHQKIASKTYYTLGKNLGILFTRYALIYKGCSCFNRACARYCLNDFSRSPLIYSPTFLYGLLDVFYPHSDQSSGKLRVKPLDKEEVAIFTSLIDRLDREYRAYMNNFEIPNPLRSVRYVTLEGLSSTPVGSPVLDGQGQHSFEFDMYGTLSRYIVDIPDRFIEMVDLGDPRALILVAYNILILSVRVYEYWPKSVFGDEIIYIDHRLDKVENSELWKSWLSVAYLSVNSR
ncbi:hypothetical protein FOA43_000310 [Brettanomyces nanus]|uniref:Uncharacterized protein n=1 Tax=Eeniella nana TaxID=13502 RepID=A0A875RW60_EENNA|nr:uncharacterized protein FOA43_000310 [Brettanomyces nanus]QPG73006.1 hypothetical protein FOA43_000310 [Brettanomyces nanus]